MSIFLAHLSWLETPWLLALERKWNVVCETDVNSVCLEGKGSPCPEFQEVGAAGSGDAWHGSTLRARKMKRAD
jgi:hypothetical protein